jgi:hypothetical protein
LAPAVLQDSDHVPVPHESVNVQDPPAPLTDTEPVGVPALPETVAVTVVFCPSVIVVGLRLIDTVGVAFVTLKLVVPLDALYVALPL